MKTKILSIFVMLFIFSSSIATSVNLDQTSNESNFERASLLNGGFLEERDGIKILYISGSYYQMGYQHGYLLKDEIQQNLRAALANAEDNYGISESQLKAAWNLTQEYMPQEILDEFQGMADGADICFERLNYINLIPIIHHTDIPVSQQCSSFTAWGPATSDGELIHTASVDITLKIEDPVTGKRAQENQILIVRNPENGYASMYPAYAGWHGWNGINTQGIGIGVTASWSDSTTYKAIPIKYRTQLAMDTASTSEEAIEIIRQDNEVGWTVIVSDAKVPVSHVLELNADTTYIGTYDSDCESYAPFWEIDHVIRRSNFFISRSLAATQRSHYSPKSLLLMLLGQNNFYPFWRIYLGLSKGIQNNWGSIDIDNAMEIMMNAYNGIEDSFISFVHRFGVLNNLAKKVGYLQALNQFAASPKTGDMLVTFAGRDTPSYENPVHSFNLFELLDHFESLS